MRSYAEAAPGEQGRVVGNLLLPSEPQDPACACRRSHVQVATVAQQTLETCNPNPGLCTDQPWPKALDKRRFPRIPVRSVISIQLSSGLSVNAMMVNLCAGGAGFLYEAPAEIGATLRFTFSLNAGGGPRMIELQGVVRHCHLTPQGFYTGVEWQDVREDICCIMRALSNDRVRLKESFVDSSIKQ